jgi:hypothetical protein
MHLQPNRNYISNDDVQTPLALARRVVAHFRPRGRILEPCAGHGNFLRALRSHACSTRRPVRPVVPLRSRPRIRRRRVRSQQRSAFHSSHRSHLPGSRSSPSFQSSRCRSSVAWCEIQRGRDFFAWRSRVDWIVTNPPWNQMRAFLQHSMAVSDHVVFLITVNHVWTRARLRDMHTAGFGIREILLVDTPKEFPPLGFQLGAVHLAHGWRGPIRLTGAAVQRSVDVVRRPRIGVRQQIGFFGTIRAMRGKPISCQCLPSTPKVPLATTLHA